MSRRYNTLKYFIKNFRETQSGMYDMILHVGDFAYDMDTVSDFMKNLSIKRTSSNYNVLTTLLTIDQSFYSKSGQCSRWRRIYATN